MINGGVRTCDVCGEVIPRGTKYVMHVLPQYAAELLMDEDHEMVPTFTVDADGNVRLDICLNCKANMGIQAEIVN
jgi:hypothetical protein